MPACLVISVWPRCVCACVEERGGRWCERICRWVSVSVSRNSLRLKASQRSPLWASPQQQIPQDRLSNDKNNCFLRYGGGPRLFALPGLVKWTEMAGVRVHSRACWQSNNGPETMARLQPSVLMEQTSACSIWCNDHLLPARKWPSFPLLFVSNIEDDFNGLIDVILGTKFPLWFPVCPVFVSISLVTSRLRTWPN